MTAPPLFCYSHEAVKLKSPEEDKFISPPSCSVNFKWVDGLLTVSLNISLFKEITKTEIQNPGFITWLGQYALTEIY